MKFRRLGACALCLTAALTFGLAGCGDGGRQLGEHEKGDRTEITFLCSINTTSQKAWDSLIAAYNDASAKAKEMKDEVMPAGAGGLM